MSAALQAKAETDSAAGGKAPGIDASMLASLADLSQALALSVDITRTLDLLVNRIVETMGAEAASIFLVDDSGTQLECRACAGPADIVGLRVPIDTGIVGRTYESNACSMVRDASSDPDFATKIDDRTGFVTRSILCAPLSVASGPIGVIEVLNKRDGALFDDSDRELLRMLAAPAVLAVGNAQMATDLIEKNRIVRELQLARRMQRMMLPKRRRSGFPVIAFNRPANEISGDFYDFFDLPDGRIAFTVGDVSGKGLDASLLMIRTASLLRWIGKEGRHKPSDWLTLANAELASTVSGGMFVCAVAGYYDRKKGHAQWASAGFPPALLRDAFGELQELPAGGPPLGIVEDCEWQDESVDMSRGSLYFYSDGVTDVVQANGERLGVAGVRTLIGGLSHLPAEARLRAMLGILRRLKLADDTTLMLIEGGR